MGGLAVLGQGLFAGSNFLVNVLLARWLTPEQYGGFALAYAGFLLFLMLYAACVYEPLIVFGSGRYAGRFREYFGLLARGNVIVLAAFTFLMVASSFLFSRFFPSGVERDFAALSLAAPFVLVSWLGRGGFYARMKPGAAAWGGSIYFFTVLLAVVALRMDGQAIGEYCLSGHGTGGPGIQCFLGLPAWFQVEGRHRQLETETGVERSLELRSLGVGVCGGHLVPTECLLRVAPRENRFGGGSRSAGPYKFD